MNFYTSIFNGKKFLKVSLAVIFFMLIMQFIALEYFARYINEKETVIIPVPNNISLAIIGTSHASYGLELVRIDPSIFHYIGSYTFPIIMHKKLQNLIKDAPGLKYLLLEADYHQFYDFSYLTPRIYSRHSHLFGDSSNTFISLEKEVSMALHNKLLEHLFNKIKIKQKKSTVTQNNWAEVDQDKRTKQTQQRYTFYGFSNEKSMNIHSIDYYEKTIELALKNDIEVILIRHPSSNDYLNSMYPKMTIDVGRLIDNLSEKYNLKKFDYRYYFKDKQHLFADMVHLNEGGVDEFSKLLINDIITKTSFNIKYQDEVIHPSNKYVH